MEFSTLTDGLGRNIFSELDDKKRELEAAGREVFNLSVGTPDFEPDGHVMRELRQRAADPANYRYSLSDLPELTETVVDWYAARFGVQLERDEVTSVSGSQEGVGHTALALVNAGDTVLTPDPGYPIFTFGAKMARARIEHTPLLEENGFLVDFDSIPQSVAHAARLMVVSYPSNPVTAVAPPEFYEKLVWFAKKYDIFVVHDNAYCELVFDGKKGMSFLNAKGAKDVGMEFNSLSKSYNLTGMRASFAVGNREMVGRLVSLRSQIDYGMFYPIQYAAMAALRGPQDILQRNRERYQQRRDVLCGGLRGLGWDVKNSPATMFVWAKIPPVYATSREFVLALIERAGVVCTPGSAFGARGEGYVRFALTCPADGMRRMLSAIGESGVLAGPR